MAILSWGNGEADAEPLIIPTISVEQAVTDNALVTSDNKVLDGVTTTALDLEVQGKTRHVEISGTGAVRYNKYVASSELDGFGLDLSGRGRAEIVDRFLFLDANAVVSDELTNRVNVPATARTSAINTARVSTYEVGPTVTTKLGNFATVLLRGRYAEVDIGDPSTTPLPLGLQDSSILQGSGLISTSEAIRPYAMTVAGEYYKQNQGFVLYNGVYSLFVGRPQGIRLIGRIGYESVFDPGITDIKGMIWSAGAIWRQSDSNFIRVEYGSRFDEPTWNGALAWAFSPKLYITGEFTKSVETEQSRLRRSLTDLLEPNGEFPISAPIVPEDIQIDLIGATALNEDLNFGIAYRLNPLQTGSVNRGGGSYAGTMLEISGGISRRRVFETNTQDKLMRVDAVYRQDLNRQLNLEIRGRYEKVLTAQPGELQDMLINTEWKVDYALSRGVYAGVTYVWQKNYLTNGGSIPENVISFGVRKRF